MPAVRQQLVDTAGWMGVRVTDAFSRLLEAVGSEDMPNEVEARWRLVETAWRLQIGSSMLATYDEGSGALLLPNKQLRRTAVTSCRDALNGYLQGKCFYCSAPISTVDQETLADVDHFFPHALKQIQGGIVGVGCGTCPGLPGLQSRRRGEVSQRARRAFTRPATCAQ